MAKSFRLGIYGPQGHSCSLHNCSCRRIGSRPGRSTASTTATRSPSWAPCSASTSTFTRPRIRLGTRVCFTGPSCAVSGTRAASGTSMQSIYPKACRGSSMPTCSRFSTRNTVRDLFPTVSSFGTGVLESSSLARRKSRIRRVCRAAQRDIRQVWCMASAYSAKSHGINNSDYSAATGVRRSHQKPSSFLYPPASALLTATSSESVSPALIPMTSLSFFS